MKGRGGFAALWVVYAGASFAAGYGAAAALATERLARRNDTLRRSLVALQAELERPRPSPPRPRCERSRAPRRAALMRRVQAICERAEAGLYGGDCLRRRPPCPALGFSCSFAGWAQLERFLQLMDEVQSAALTYADLRFDAPRGPLWAELEISTHLHPPREGGRPRASFERRR